CLAVSRRRSRLSAPAPRSPSPWSCRRAAMHSPSPILIADDHALIRKGLRQVIETDSHFEVVGEAVNGKEALALIVERQPRIAVLDVNMPEMNGFDVAREITKRKLDVAIIFLTMHKDQNFFNKAMDIGARGYVLKDGALDEIIDAINTVVRGQPYISP